MEHIATGLIVGALIAWTGCCFWNIGRLSQKRKFMSEKTEEGELLYISGVLDCISEVMKGKSPLEITSDPEIMGKYSDGAREPLARWRRKGVEAPENTIPFRRM